MPTPLRPLEAKGSISLSEIIGMLEPTLGREKSDELVRGAASTLGLRKTVLDKVSALALIDQLGRGPGVAGLAARFIRSRYLREATSSVPPAARPEVTLDSEAPPPSSRSAVTEGSLVQLLAPTLGAEKSAELIAAAAARLGVDMVHLDRDSALRILDTLAAGVGIVGVAARFAKARAILVFA